MAQAVAEGAGADLFEVSELDAGAAAQYGALALGCPAMGAEVLEESAFEPFSQNWNRILRENPWRCSAPTDGVTDSGCLTGPTGCGQPARSCVPNR